MTKKEFKKVCEFTKKLDEEIKVTMALMLLDLKNNDEELSDMRDRLEELVYFCKSQNEIQLLLLKEIKTDDEVELVDGK